MEKREPEEMDEVQILPNNQALSLFVKAEIDTQIATAKAFPRSLKAFLQKTESMATVTAEVAESCSYALIRKKKDKKGGWENYSIEGPSIRFAEIVASSYGNIRAGARVVSNDGKVITAQGMCVDLETNTVVTLEVQRRITDSMGRTFSEDMQVVTGNAACAIAFRNAVFRVIPAALTEEIYERVKEVAKGSAETLDKRRKKAIDFFVNTYKVKEAQIFEVLEVSAMEEIDLDKLQKLTGLKTALKNGDTTVEETFAAHQENKDKASKTERIAEADMKAAMSKANGGNK